MTTKDEGEITIVKEEKTEEETAAKKMESLEQKLVLEFNERASSITAESLGIEINPNCFLNFKSDVDESQVKKDEDCAREMANLIVDYLLPTLVKQIREEDVVPRDSDMLVNYLHRTGVNVRYIGRLAMLAHEQEKEDVDLLVNGKQRIHAMPGYFLEMLIVEMIARATKHLMNSTFRSNPSVAANPAQSVTSLLNHIMSALRQSEQDAEEEPARATTGENGEKLSDGETGADDKKNKKKKKKVVKAATDLIYGTCDAVDSPPDGFPSRKECISSLNQIILSRYLFHLSLFDDSPLDGIEGEPDLAKMLANLSSIMLSKRALRNRISPLMLLRRICQQCGIIIAARDYDFTSAEVFKVEDLVSLVPKIKSCEPDSYPPEFSECLNNSIAMLQEGNPLVAFELAQQAMGIITQVSAVCF